MRRTYYLLAGLLACLGLALACRWLVGQIDWRKAWDEFDGGAWSVGGTNAAYEFDLHLISTTLPIGEFLTPAPLREPTPSPDAQVTPVTLNDDVLYGIAGRLLEAGDARLVGVTFELSCANVEVGPRLTTFFYERFENKIPSFPYLQENVNINAEWGRVWYHSCRVDSRHSDMERPVIDYPSLPVRIYEALQIAEDSGGREFRNSVNDACVIRGGLSGNTWRVAYIIGGEKPVWALRVEIDAVSGRVIRISE